MTLTNEADIRSRLSSVRCFLLDMDGTFYLGDRLIPGSLDFLAALERTGRTARFLTNNSSKSATVYAKKLAAMGVPERYCDVISSAHAAAHYCLSHFPGKKCYLLGNPALTEEMQAMGLELTEEGADYVLVGFDTTLDYAKMCRVCDYIRGGLPYIATHPDFNCPTETGFIPDMGAIMAFIEASTGRKADVILGKPYPGIVEEALARTGYTLRETAVVGDRLYTDVATGVRHGMTGILVLSGETKKDDIASSDVVPDLVFGRLSDMIPYLS
ncbi:MAG: HAD-IIA family hydrolase [Clostridia bacterium]|nr:HAD-IIA family hydrolase [Clostridia bacterium]